MKLYHYTNAHFPFIDTTKWKDQVIGPKPKGLWLSDDDGDPDNSWAAWCRSEEFRLDNLRYRYAGTLRGDANILYLRSSYEIDHFTKKYGRDYETAWRMHDNPHMDWSQVAEKYQGIVISPYQWSRRLDGQASWYYGWDCASACIWSMKVFDRFDFDCDTTQLLTHEEQTNV